MKYSLSRECFIACCLRTAPDVEFTSKYAVFTFIYFSFYSCEREEKKKRSDVRGLVSATVCYEGSVSRDIICPSYAVMFLKGSKTYHSSDESLLLDIRCCAGV